MISLRHRVTRSHRRQRGVAVVTALLLTTLAVTIVASLFWQQQIQVRSIENQRLQLQQQWVLRGALDWARLILREDARTSTLDALTEPWATPLAPTRLDQYVQSGTVRGDAGSAVLSGFIQDAQGRFNLTNLATQGEINPAEVQAFARLLALLKQDPGLANSIAQFIAQAGRAALNPRPDIIRPIGFVQLDDLLVVPGCTPRMISILQPYVIILPSNTTVNINTASPEVLAASISGLSIADANILINSRRQAAIRDLGDLATRLSNRTLSFDGGRLGVTSSFFVVRGNVAIRHTTLQIDALVERKPNATRLVWVREI